MATDYLSFFNLSDDPFRLTPDISYFYNSPAHATALLSLEYCVTHKEGFCILTGEPGTGKTTIIRLFTEKWKDRAEIALIMTPRLSPDEFFRAILDDFKIPLCSSKNDMLKAFRGFLLEHAAQNRRVTIIVDEAQELPDETIEELRLLSNLETEKEKLLQIILIGQPELRVKLLSEQLRQINQRITVRVQLNPLTEAETSDYINTRLIRGGNSSLLFSQRAKELIFNISGGIPRTINLLASRGLMSAFLNESNEVKEKHIELGAYDVMEPAAALPAAAKQSSSEKRRKNERVLPSDLDNGFKSPRAIFMVAVFLTASAAALVLMYLKYYYSPQPVVTPYANRTLPVKPVLAKVSTAFLAKSSAVKKVVVKTEDPFDAMVSKEITTADSHATALKSFNALTAEWKIPTAEQLEKQELPAEKGLEKTAAIRGMELFSYSGTLDRLLFLDYPAVIVIGTSSTGKEIYTSLLKVTGKEYMISPPSETGQRSPEQSWKKSGMGKDLSSGRITRKFILI